MKTSLVSCFVVLFCVVGVCRADERTAEQTKAAKDFKFEGVTFATTVAEFKKLHPNAKEDKESDKKLKVEQYIVPSQAADRMAVYFFEGKLYEMRILYRSKQLDKIGGDAVLIERLRDKFGKADASSPGVTKKTPLEYEFEWEMKDANKSFAIIGKDDYVRIDAVDTLVNAKILEAKKKTADTGFDK